MPGRTFSGLVISELSGARFDVAMDLFREGKSICFDEVQMQLTKDDALQISVESPWNTENISESRALADLNRGISVVDALTSVPPAFADSVRGKSRRVQLIDDNGTGAVRLCELTDGRVQWKPNRSSTK